MTQDERQNLLRTVAEAHTGLSEVAFKLRREVTPQAPALKAAIKAERETFRLKRELQRLDIEDLEQTKGARGSTRRVMNKRVSSERGESPGTQGPSRGQKRL